MTDVPNPKGSNVVQDASLADNRRSTTKPLLLRRAGKRGLRPWRRLKGRFQQQRAGYGSILDSQTSYATDEPRTENLIQAAVSSLRNLASPGSPLIQSDAMRSHRATLGTDSAQWNGDIVVQENRTWVASRFEAFLRQICLLPSLAYVLGVYYPRYVSMVSSIVEYSLVAWITCLAILLVTAVRQKLAEPAQVNSFLEERVVPYGDGLLEGQEELRPLLRESRSTGDLEAGLGSAVAVREYYDETRELDQNLDEEQHVTTRALSPSRPPSIESPQVSESWACVHPALEPFYVIDTSNGQRVFPNSSQAFLINTDYFEGRMMVLIRTPNVDDPSLPIGTEENAATTHYLTGRQRRFEFQFQVRLKKVPQGRVYFACELGKSVKMGMIQRAFIGAAMSFVKATNSSFHYSMTGNPASIDGKYERPHMAFPVEEGMNRVVRTAPGQPLPVLGATIVEDTESIKRRGKGVPVEWNVEDTYTLSLWSAYVDFLDWRCMNLPGIRPFGLTNVVGRQPIYLTLYEIKDGRDSDKHYHCDMIKIVEFEMCNAPKSEVGEAAEKWMSVRGNAIGVRGLGVIANPADQLIAMGHVTVYPFVEDDEDENAAAELGDGIYVCSGDVVSLRESTEGDEETESSCFLSSGGGFAVLQEHHISNIIIEKAGKSRTKENSVSSRLIKNGDTVIIKLVLNGRKVDETVTKYLSLHRGWWLKWVSTVPTKNGFFTIHTNESAVGQVAQGDNVISTVTSSSSSYLNLGCSFYLKHKRWSKYLVGVAREASAAYGGRMLRLYNKKGGNQGFGYNSDEDDIQMDGEQPELDGREGEFMIKALRLELFDAANSSGSSTNAKVSNFEPTQSLTPRELLFSCEDYQMDAPVWLEVMNRTERVRQLVYVVRVTPPPEDTSDFQNDDSKFDGAVEESASTQEAFMRLRTGRDLAHVMRVGLSWRNNNASPRRRKFSTDQDALGPPISPCGSTSPVSTSRDDPCLTPTRDALDQLSTYSYDQIGDADFNMTSRDEESSEGSVAEAKSDTALEIDEEELGFPMDDLQLSRPGKGRKLIGKIAKSVKSRTTTTGKKVVRQSVKVGKGTMNAGKAMISGRPKNPPGEPKSSKPRPRRKVERDLRVPVSNKAMRRVERVESSLEPHFDSSSLLAGQLTATEQSRRTVSTMLSRMSSVPSSSMFCAEFSSLLGSQVNFKSHLDFAFLQGGAVELGVIPNSHVETNGLLVLDFVVARCLWESHWREEWCSLHERCILFYRSLTKEPCLEVSFGDIQGVRMVDSDLVSPLPGCFILVVETAWICHYIALGSHEARATFCATLEEALTSFRVAEEPQKTEPEVELSKARLWQGLEASLKSARSSCTGKWADVSSGQKRKSRVILNNRRMSFDFRQPTMGIDAFVEDLLSTSLSFSLDSLEYRPQELSIFLDSTSMLRGLPLQALDRTATSTYCIFVNLYHCLLQHALLFTPNGPLNKRSCGHFMRTNCYEIGGDVFSLAELNCCILRGNMSRPITAKAPYVEAPKKSNSYRFFSLTAPSPNVNFLINTGDVSCPREIPVLQPYHLQEQLTVQTAEFLRKNVTVDVDKKQIFIPKVCELYRHDFCPDSSSAGSTCLRFCLRYLDEPIASKIHDLLQDEAAVSIKYQPLAEQYHSTLGPGW